MSVEATKKLISSFYEALEQKNFEIIEELCHKDFVFYTQVDTPIPGVEGFFDAEKKFMDAFPDFKMPVKAIFVEGDRAAVYFFFEGTHTGGALGIPATGKLVKISLMAIFRIAEGKILEKRAHYEKADIFHQIGVNV